MIRQHLVTFSFFPARQHCVFLSLCGFENSESLLFHSRLLSVVLVEEESFELGCAITSENIVLIIRFDVTVKSFLSAAVTKDLALQLLPTVDDEHKRTRDPNLDPIPA